MNDEIQILESLIDELIAGLQDVLQSGEVLSDEFQGAIAEELNLASERLDQLYAERGQESVENVPSSVFNQHISDDSRLLWILSGEDPNAFVSYLRTYPGEDFQYLLNNPNALAQTISELQRENPFQPPGIDKDGIPETMYHSSNVLGMKYNPKTGSLMVKFFGNGKPDPIYQYQGVPPQIFKLLEHGNAFAKTKGSNSRGSWWPFKNPSIGSAVNQYLKKGNYQYKRLR